MMKLYISRGKGDMRMVEPPEWQNIDTRFARKLDPRGELHIFSCYQCKKCSSGCPMERDSDLHPHEIIRMVQMGRKEEAVRSKGIWTCVSCQTCVSRCPMNVNTPAVIDILRGMASRRDTRRTVRQVPIFNRVFLGWLRSVGRIYELGMIGTFKLTSMSLFADLEKFPTMLRKGKLRLFPSVPGRRGNLRRIFRRARELSK